MTRHPILGLGPVARALLAGEPVWLLDPRSTHDVPTLCVGPEDRVRADLEALIGEPVPATWTLRRVEAT